MDVEAPMLTNDNQMDDKPHDNQKEHDLQISPNAHVHDWPVPKKSERIVCTPA